MAAATSGRSKDFITRKIGPDSLKHQGYAGDHAWHSLQYSMGSNS